MILDSKIPVGPLSDKWKNHKFNLKLVNPANKRKYDIIVVGTGLAGASAAASLGELGYNVKAFCFQDSPRRAHSIAAQGGINAAKNYQNDGDSIYRLFYDTIKGGDYRARESNVHRLAEVSVSIIDQCVAQGVPFAREYGGLLDNRSFGGSQVSRTFYARGQTGQQLLLGAYSALSRQVGLGKVTMYRRHEMLDLVTVDGVAKGIVTRNLITGAIESHAAHAVLLCTGGYGNVFYLSTNAQGSNVTAAWRAHKKGALFANPCFTQIHPTCIPVSGDHQSKLTLMSESLRNDGRIWVPAKPNDTRKAADIPEDERDYYLERRYPAFGNLVPRDIASRAAKERCDAGYGVGASKMAVYLDYASAIERYGKAEALKKGLSNPSKEDIKKLGTAIVAEKYGNLFDMYTQITGENPYEEPMRIYPAVHYTMGGLWVDYNLQTTIPGLYALGECNFSDHGANRLGASALMQGLADGYFVIPYTVGDYLASIPSKPVDKNHPAFKATEDEVKAKINKFLSIKGNKTVTEFHRELGKIMWEYCGMARNEAGLKKAKGMIQELKKEFWSNVKVAGENEELNNNLERAARVADFIELGELMVDDALNRNESCGGHFREEYQTEEGEALRDDENYHYVAAWEFKGENQPEELHKEKLIYEQVKPSQRSYK
ncbi:MAG: succinate dehydrogenase subunit [Bacteroidota bacterium]|jgi:succinate dehydrogenase / fumarate reductase flavoprotein subunit